ncbi:MAG: hypothetical protein JWN76_3715 [Chitinophagaceae bacterium]|nr:hypothetical protein [Chitinophagaceae bacterium]
MRKNKIYPICLVSISAALILYSCSNKKADLTAPSSANCDTTTVRLSVEIKAIMTAQCFSCHGGNATLANGIQLENYSVLKAYVNNGQLLQAITHTGNVTPMPNNGTLLSACDINKFRAWINRGAQNN